MLEDVKPETFMFRPLLRSSDESSPSHVLLHLTFILTGVAYMSGDILQLRCVSMSSMLINLGLLICMPKPPKTPIFWTSFYVMINLIWSSSIYFERASAENMPPELQSLYTNGKFEERGQNSVEF